MAVKSRARRSGPRPGRAPREVFLSFADKDRHFARKIARELRLRGIKTWFAPSHLKGGDQWHDAIGDALARCDWFLVVLSPSAIRSPWVKSELVYALDERRLRSRIVPIIFKKCVPKRLSWALPAIQHISFWKRRFGDALRDLLATWEL